jgi:hypothetical protein
MKAAEIAATKMSRKPSLNRSPLSISSFISFS